MLNDKEMKGQWFSTGNASGARFECFLFLNKSTKEIVQNDIQNIIINKIFFLQKQWLFNKICLIDIL